MIGDSVLLLVKNTNRTTILVVSSHGKNIPGLQDLGDRLDRRLGLFQ